MSNDGPTALLAKASLLFPGNARVNRLRQALANNTPNQRNAADTLVKELINAKTRGLLTALQNLKNWQRAKNARVSAPGGPSKRLANWQKTLGQKRKRETTYNNLPGNVTHVIKKMVLSPNGSTAQSVADIKLVNELRDLVASVASYGRHMRSQIKGRRLSNFPVPSCLQVLKTHVEPRGFKVAKVMRYRRASQGVKSKHFAVIFGDAKSVRDLSWLLVTFNGLVMANVHVEPRNTWRVSMSGLNQNNNKNYFAGFSPNGEWKRALLTPNQASRYRRFEGAIKQGMRQGMQE